MKRLLSLLLLISFLIWSCEPDHKPQPRLGKVQLVFENEVDGIPLKLEETIYTNAAGNLYSVEKLIYYVSNISLDGCECKPFIEQESYHLVELWDNPLKDGLVDEHTITLEDVPVGNYKKLDFSIGVDAVRNSSGRQTGALDPLRDMFWGWANGYIFWKLEGSWKNGEENGDIIFHIGGDEAYKTIELPLEAVEVVENETTVIKIQANINKAFEGATTIDFKKLSSTMAIGVEANAMADNYSKMFTIK